MIRFALAVRCAAGMVALTLLASTGFAQTSRAYIPGNKFDYLINGLRTPGSYSPGYVAPAYNPPQYYNSGYYFAPRQDVPANAALIEMRVPANAEVWFSGEKTTQTGDTRAFVTPALESGHKYAYRIKVRWKDEKGQPVEREKKVPVQPGSRVSLDFE
jgi:uncharacterized protein (TIGR03000 family)